MCVCLGAKTHRWQQAKLTRMNERSSKFEVSVQTARLVGSVCVCARLSEED